MSTALMSAPSTQARRALVVALAAAVGLLAWTAIHYGGLDLMVRGAQVGPVMVVAAGVAAGLAGWALLAVLERSARNARRLWTIIASAVLLVSLLGPLGATDPADRVGLAALHLAVGAVLVTALPRTALPRKAPRGTARR